MSGGVGEMFLSALREVDDSVTFLAFFPGREKVPEFNFLFYDS